MRPGPTRQIGAQILLVCAAACTQQNDTTEDTQPADAPTTALHVEWTFDASRDEKATAAVLLDALVESPRGPKRGASGVLYLFDPNSNNLKLLVLTYIQPNASDVDPEAVLYVLEEESPRIAPPLVIGRWGLGGFGPVTVEDYDGDGQLDVSFCQWPEDETQVGAPTVSGFTNGEWYTIVRPNRPLPECQA